MVAAESASGEERPLVAIPSSLNRNDSSQFTNFLSLLVFHQTLWMCRPNSSGFVLLASFMVHNIPHPTPPSPPLPTRQPFLRAVASQRPEKMEAAAAGIRPGHYRLALSHRFPSFLQPQ